MIVPDSIEPIVGWKGLQQDRGMLRSAFNSSIWELGKPFRATCLVPRSWRAVWRPLSFLEQDLPEDFLGDARGHGALGFAGATGAVGPYFAPVAVTTSAMMISLSDVPDPEPPPAPAIELPHPYHWCRVIETDPPHTAPHAGCSCGIYVAASRDEASHYGHGIAVEVFGWGRVIEHSGGWRCQFAYPKKIYVPESEYDERLQDYGVEVEIVKDTRRVSSPAMSQNKPSSTKSNLLWAFVLGIELTLVCIFIAGMVLGWW
jgi:hypothetical protein